jgi:hypothetical protein
MLINDCAAIIGDLRKVRELHKKKKKQLDTEVLKDEEDNIYNR